mgnify:CR=1 FL=1
MEQGQIETLLASTEKQWATVAWQVGEVKKAFGPNTPLGKRRTTFAVAPTHAVGDIEMAMIEREPITVIVSRLGWIRAMKGHQPKEAEVKFRDGDEGRFVFRAETTDRILVAGSNGRFYTLLGANLPGGRGMGEPLRLMVDLPNEAEIVDLILYRPGQKFIVASTAGEGFVVPADEVVAQTRAGKQVMNLSGAARMAICRPIAGDHVAVVSKNRKLLAFPLDELPEMTRGKGVRLQKYKDGGLSDLKTFAASAGLTWTDSSGRTYSKSMADLGEWVAERATAGRQPPTGFPRNNRFTG